MYVAEHTSKVLKLKPEKGILLSNLPILLIALVFSSISVVIILAFAKITTLKCDRIEPERVSCELTSSGFVSHNSILIEDLQSAEIQSDTNSDGDKIYRIVLIANQNKIIPFNKVYSSGGTESMAENVGIINSFIKKSAEASLTVEKDDRLVTSIVLSPAIIIAGVVLLFFMLRKTLRYCNFDKDYGRVVLNRKNIISQEITIEERLENIKKAVAHYEGVSQNRKKVYNIKLMRNIGKSIFLYSSIYPEEITKTINQFLEVDDEE